MKIYRISQTHFLDTPESAWEWAKENVDIEVHEGNIESEYDQEIFNDYIEKCRLYSERYHDVMSSPTVQVYRAIKVPSIEDINWKKVGTHWSFEKSCAGSYGDFLKKYIKYDDIILTGICNTKDIDWEYCFTSFMYYGEQQWECSIDDYSQIRIVAINGKPTKIIAHANSVKIYRIAADTFEDDLNDLQKRVKEFENATDFEDAHTGSNLFDLSDREKHRMERAFGPNEDTIESVLTNSEYLLTIKQSAPRTYSALLNGKSTITMYRAVPPTKIQLINFFQKEMAKILKRGDKYSYPYMNVLNFKNVNEYYEFLYSEINSGGSSFRFIEDNSIKIGDLVALDRGYAKMHGESIIMFEQKYPTYAIVSKTAPKRDVVWGQADWNEWVYSPQSIRDEYPNGLKDFYERHKI